jgi:hypothetical protein
VLCHLQCATSGLYYKHVTTLVSLMSNVTIWNITLESSIMILEASFTLIYDVYSAGITYDNRQWAVNLLCASP